MNYKNVQKNIGASDVASLIMSGCGEGGSVKLDLLKFSEDGSYSAYIIYDDAEVPDHYRLVAEFKTWLKIYDDDRMTAHFKAERIEVYRAGQRGCLIRLCN